MTENEIEAKVTSVLPTANLGYAVIAGVVSYMIAGSIVVNPMGVLLVLVVLIGLYFLPPVQREVRRGLRKLVLRVNR